MATCTRAWSGIFSGGTTAGAAVRAGDRSRRAPLSLCACIGIADGSTSAIAEGMSTAWAWTCRYSKRPPRPRAPQRYAARAKSMAVLMVLHISMRRCTAVLRTRFAHRPAAYMHTHPPALAPQQTLQTCVWHGLHTVGNLSLRRLLLSTGTPMPRHSNAVGDGR